MFPWENPQPRRKKKVDTEALHSPLARVPGMDLITVRGLLDLGVREVEEVNGRSPEALFEAIRKTKPDFPEDRLYSLRMLVYYAETPEPDPNLLQPWRWQ